MSNGHRNRRNTARDRDRATDLPDTLDLEMMFLKLIALLLGMK